MKKEASIPLQNKLSFKVSILMVLLIGILFSSMIITITSVTESKVKKSTYEMQRLFTEKSAAEFDNWVDKYLSDLKVFSHNSINKTGNVDVIVSWFKNNQNLKHDDFLFVIYVDDMGTSYFADGTILPEHEKQEDYYRAIFHDKQDSYVGKIFKSEVFSQWVIPVVQSVKNDRGNPIGFYLGALKFETIYNKVLSTKVGDTGRFLLADKKTGEILAYEDNSFFLKKLPSSRELNELLSSNRNNDFSMPFNGQQFHTFGAQVKNAGWLLLFTMAEDEILLSVNETKVITIFFGVIIAICVLIAFIL